METFSWMIRSRCLALEGAVWFAVDPSQKSHSVSLFCHFLFFLCVFDSLHSLFWNNQNYTFLCNFPMQGSFYSSLFLYWQGWCCLFACVFPALQHKSSSSSCGSVGWSKKRNTLRGQLTVDPILASFSSCDIDRVRPPMSTSLESIISFDQSLLFEHNKMLLCSYHNFI